MVRYDYNIFGAITAVKNGSNQTITDTTSLAFLNPLRYHGYVFDDETGLYYLQSRYYDPVTGRFINADVYADTGSGSPLSTNMFAYCENNSLYKMDSNGKDACWIQAPKSVPLGPISFITFGHTSLLIQEKKGVWWYFYWGDKSVQLLYLHTTNLKNINSDVDRVLNDFRMTRNFSKNKLKYDNVKRIDSYTQSLWFKGNFTDCLNSIKENMEYQNRHYSNARLYKFSYSRNPREPQSWVLYGNPEYNFLVCNCMQRSVQVLLNGKLYQNQYTFLYRLIRVMNFITPNHAFTVMRYGIGIFDYKSIGVWTEI